MEEITKKHLFSLFSKLLITQKKGYNYFLYDSLHKVFNSDRVNYFEDGEILKQIQLIATDLKGYDIINLEEKIRPGETIVKVPFMKGLNGMDLDDYDESIRPFIKSQIHYLCKTIANHSKKPENYERLYQHLILMNQTIININNKEANSHDFTMSFPSQHFNLPTTPESIFNTAYSNRIKQGIINYQQLVKFMHEKANEDKILMSDLNDFYYVYNTVNSRKIEVNSEKGKIYCIVPLLDLINHDSIPNAKITVEWDILKETNNL